MQSKKCYEKVGEATETALIVLVEKMNVTSIELKPKTKAEKAHTCNDALRSLYKKVFDFMYFDQFFFAGQFFFKDFSLFRKLFSYKNYFSFIRVVLSVRGLFFASMEQFL